MCEGEREGRERSKGGESEGRGGDALRMLPRLVIHVRACVRVSGAQMGIVLTMPISGLLCEYVSWDSVFWVFGGCVHRRDYIMPPSSSSSSSSSLLFKQLKSAVFTRC